MLRNLLLIVLLAAVIGVAWIGGYTEGRRDTIDAIMTDVEGRPIPAGCVLLERIEI
jgi:hypothetical protein